MLLFQRDFNIKEIGNRSMEQHVIKSDLADTNRSITICEATNKKLRMTAVFYHSIIIVTSNRPVTNGEQRSIDINMSRHISLLLTEII
uniref:Uncharacterized protein n=1 Tax=Arion vulgaris TaxID=1028688 RepID=A0A0B7ACP9_9EUPU